MTLSQYNSVNFKKVSTISWFVQGTPIQVNTAVVFVVLLLTPLYPCVLPICVNRSEIVALPDSNALQKSYLYQAIGIQYEYTELHNETFFLATIEWSLPERGQHPHVFIFPIICYAPNLVVHWLYSVMFLPKESSSKKWLYNWVYIGSKLMCSFYQIILAALKYVLSPQVRWLWIRQINVTHFRLLIHFCCNYSLSES